MTDGSIEVRDLVKVYKRGGETLRVLDGLNLDMEGGRFYALMGPSGSGKTTLLNLIGGLDTFDGGSLIVSGADMSRLRGADLSRWRAANVGFVFQGFNLIPVLSALENVMLPLQLAPVSRKERRERAEYALDLVGMKDRMKHRPRELSGGQEQRVAIARAFVTDPAVLLADEPTGDLDRETADSVLDLMVELNEKLSKSILMVTHDPRAAERAQRVVHLDKGQLGRIDENRHEPAGATS